MDGRPALPSTPIPRFAVRKTNSLTEHSALTIAHIGIHSKARSHAHTHARRLKTKQMLKSSRSTVPPNAIGFQNGKRDDVLGIAGLRRRKATGHAAPWVCKGLPDQPPTCFAQQVSNTQPAPRPGNSPGDFLQNQESCVALRAPSPSQQNR